MPHFDLFRPAPRRDSHPPAGPDHSAQLAHCLPDVLREDDGVGGQSGVEVPVSEREFFKVAGDKSRLRQPLAGDGQQGVAGVEAGDFGCYSE